MRYLYELSTTMIYLKLYVLVQDLGRSAPTRLGRHEQLETDAILPFRGWSRRSP